MTMGKETVCSSCHGEVGPDINGCIMCYGCGPGELLPPERRAQPVEAKKDGALPQARFVTAAPLAAVINR